MKHTTAIPPVRAPRGFTLIELLVVIGIIAVLASLAFSVSRSVIANSRKVQTKAVLTDVQTAVNSYFTERHRMPLADAGEEPLRMNQGNDLVAILLGDVSGPGTPNPAGTPFLQAHPAKRGRGGLIDNDGAPPSLVDLWGNPYYIVMDTNLDARVPNPDRQNRDADIAADAPAHLRTRVAVFSAGPDGEKGTRDDIVSWR